MNEAGASEDSTDLLSTAPINEFPAAEHRPSDGSPSRVGCSGPSVLLIWMVAHFQRPHCGELSGFRK